MPAVSKSQQRAAGIALSAKRGDIDVSELEGAAKEMYNSMSTKELEDFAETEHTGLPDKKEGIIKLKDLLPEEIINESNSSELLNTYFKGTITADELIQKAGGIDRVATEKELKKFLKNKFMQDMMADTHGIDKETLVDKVKELLKKK